MKKKILFWLDQDLSYFCMSYYLKDMHNSDFYAIVDITNKPKKFFQEQKLVPFKKTWYFHDHINSKKKADLEYLSTFEKKYNIDLWKLAINERLFYRFFDFHKFTRDEILSIDEDACRLFESVLDEVKPDYIITKEPVLHHLEIFYELCRARGIKVLMLSIPKIGFRCMISDQSQRISNSIKLDGSQSKNRSLEELKLFLDTHSPYKQIKNFDIRKKFLNEMKILNNFNHMDSDNNYTNFGRTKFKVFVHSLKSLLKEKYRRSFMDKNLVKSIDFDSKFVYFPLGVDSGKEILISAPFFTNQIEVIRHIAKSLPIGYVLYVKEHPSSVIDDWRNISEYREIMNIPNVKLLHPYVNSQKLFENCQLVITISGSAGLEAAFYEKNAIVFSKQDYEILPSVFPIESISELPNLIKKAINTKTFVNDLERYVEILEKNTFEFDWFGFLVKIRKRFYLGMSPFNVEINENNMACFLEENEKQLMILSREFENSMMVKHS
jgi:hypothetical protein